MKTSRFVLLAACLAVAGCGAAKRAVEIVQDLRKVQEAVIQASGHNQVQVNLRNNRFLQISLVNSPMGDKPAAEKAVQARRVAVAAWEACGCRGSLAEVSVSYRVLKSVAVFHYSNSTDSYRFAAAELTSAKMQP